MWSCSTSTVQHLVYNPMSAERVYPSSLMFTLFQSRTTIGYLKIHWLFSFCYSMETISFIKTTKTADETSADSIVDDFFWLINYNYSMDGKLRIVEDCTKIWSMKISCTSLDHEIYFSSMLGKRTSLWVKAQNTSRLATSNSIRKHTSTLIYEDSRGRCPTKVMQILEVVLKFSS